MLTPQRFQMILFGAVGLIACYFTFQAGSKIFTYLSLREQAPAQILQWEVEEVDGKYALKAVYSFDGNRGEYRFNPPYYWNEPSAVAALKAKAKESLSAWYNPDNPSQSALERAFPRGLVFRLLICYGVLLYFFVLRRRIVNSF